MYNSSAQAEVRSVHCDEDKTGVTIVLFLHQALYECMTLKIRCKDGN